MSDFFYSLIEELYGLMSLELPEEMGISFYFTRAAKVRIGLQMEDNPQGILMAASIGQLPTGAMRQLWLQEALRWNGELGVIGALAYNPDENLLLINQLFSIHAVTAQQILDAFEPFEQRAQVWQRALESGYPPALPGAADLSAIGRQDPMSMISTATQRLRALRP